MDSSGCSGYTQFWASYAHHPIFRQFLGTSVTFWPRLSSSDGLFLLWLFPVYEKS